MINEIFGWMRIRKQFPVQSQLDLDFYKRKMMLDPYPNTDPDTYLDITLI